MKKILFFLSICFVLPHFVRSQNISAGDTVLFSVTGDTVLTRGTVVKTSGGMVNTFFAVYKKSLKADSVLDLVRMRFTNATPMTLSQLPADTLKKYHLVNRGIKVAFESVPGSEIKTMEMSREDKGVDGNNPDLHTYSATYFFQVTFAKKTLVSDPAYTTVFQANENGEIKQGDVALVSAYKMAGAEKYFVFVGVKHTKIDADGTINTDVKLKRFIVTAG
ncbi:MAG TPA: hypothetical protein VL651_17375 [Bacteroidia bacterium]|jgi:hypothetical protein|nr:hypothetical protein [Bacteroidia bacterium]